MRTAENGNITAIDIDKTVKIRLLFDEGWAQGEGSLFGKQLW